MAALGFSYEAVGGFQVGLYFVFRDFHCNRRSRFTLRPVVVAVALAFAPAMAHGQAPKRLSAWLLEQPQTGTPYPLGLSWRVPEEIPAQ